MILAKWGPKMSLPGAAHSPRAILLNRGAALLGSELGMGNFLLHAVRATEPNDLNSLPPETFEAILRQAHTRLGKHQPGAYGVEIWSPYGATASSPQIVDVMVEDTPFIVDSVLAAIRAQGATIRLISHPVIPIDPVIRPLRVLARAQENDKLLSFTHVHIDPLPSPEAVAALKAEIEAALRQVRQAVSDWKPMLARLADMVARFQQHPPRLPEPELGEAIRFMGWLADHNFTFLGMRDYRLVRQAGTTSLQAEPGSGLGILADPEYLFLRAGGRYVEMTGQHVQFLHKPEPLLVTKSNRRAQVHRRVHMDYVGVKRYDDAGNLTGETRILGLFTSNALATPNSDVPILRRKIAQVMARSEFDPNSHSGKALMAALDTYPRDELFQIEADQLFEFASLIAALPDRPRVRVLPRIDRFDNFVSVLLFVPRDRYTSALREKVGAYLAQRYEGRVSSYTPFFPEGDMVRVHFIIGRNGGTTPRPERTELEADVRALTLSFAERLQEAAETDEAVAGYRTAFSAGYEADTAPQDALSDIAMLRALSQEAPIGLRLDATAADLRLRIYHLGGPLQLSARVPLLENFGFGVIDERTEIVHPADGAMRHLHDMTLTPPGTGLDIEALAPRIEAGLLAVWGGRAENDSFNQLIATADLDWQDAALLRALARYLRQVGTTYSQSYLAATLAAHPTAAAALTGLFHLRLDPSMPEDIEDIETDYRADIARALDATTSLDEDRILRHFLNLVDAIVRTNHYQRDTQGRPRPALALKFDSTKVDELPLPRPYREIFVYAPRVEGIHLRFGPIARGGIRWSDRPQDFRTEILGLAKAQQVKNAVIVPVGAKGGFVPKLSLPNADREAVLREGMSCYAIFIGALLDVTDTIEADAVLPPEGVRRRDGDDPYLVVAADKGTARFSDLANTIARDHDFWLDDAFASGGSAGYDHKDMGITARGGWEAVKRHFRELDIDITHEPFTVVGVGDMSGDVFGNGMLREKTIRLVAAFDHRDIFIDPDPEPLTSFAERERLFALPRSSWMDYDRAKISPGGGVFSRGLKSIATTPEIRAALGITAQQLTPNALIAAILKAEADLIWFGGIGTYVRSAEETDLEVGDRANDGVRITAQELRARVIGEGANLGVTQKGRIAYALQGGRINTDAIDNSAGVNSSDLEVNLKIAFAPLLRAGTVTIEERNALLVAMTDAVAQLCLANNYQQTLTLSLAERWGIYAFPHHVDLLEALEASGRLDRTVDVLPGPTALAERAKAGQPFTRPELAVLLAHAKLALLADIVESGIVDEPFAAQNLVRYFPQAMVEAHPEAVEGHRLRREIIATVLSNALLNAGGPAFANRLSTATSAGTARLVGAFLIVRDIFDLEETGRLIDRLDGTVSGAAQLDLYAQLQALLESQTLWFLRNGPVGEDLATLAQRYREGVADVRAVLARLLPKAMADRIAAQAARSEEGGVPKALARRIAEMPAVGLATDIILVAQTTGHAVADAATAYFAVFDRFALDRLVETTERLVLSDRFDRMALERAQANLYRAVRDLTTGILAQGEGPVEDRVSGWQDAHVKEIERVWSALSQAMAGDATVSRLSVAAGLLSDLSRS